MSAASQYESVALCIMFLTFESGVLWTFMKKVGLFSKYEVRTLTGSVFMLLLLSAMCFVAAALLTPIWQAALFILVAVSLAIGIHELREWLYKTGRLK